MVAPSIIGREKRALVLQKAQSRAGGVQRFPRLARRFASAALHLLIRLPLPAHRSGLRSVLVTLDKLEHLRDLNCIATQKA